MNKKRFLLAQQSKSRTCVENLDCDNVGEGSVKLPERERETRERERERGVHLLCAGLCCPHGEHARTRTHVQHNLNGSDSKDGTIQNAGSVRAGYQCSKGWAVKKFVRNAIAARQSR
jgi:hypothetical protein